MSRNISASQPEPNSRTTQAKDVLVLDQVVKRFGEKTAVDGLSLQLRSGEVLALLGPNGAGKTTTVEMCEGFLSPDVGSVSVFGLDPAKKADEVRGRIGVMLQGGGAYPGVRVEEMLNLVASYSANPLDPEWLLETVGLASNKKTPYRRLSGGQQQRLSLACALVGRPELVFLDEPTAGLDAQSRMVVWDLVRSLKRDGAAVVLTTHLMDEAEALADRVVIVDRGKVVAHGTPAELTTVGEGAPGASGHPLITVLVDGVVDIDRVSKHMGDVVCEIEETKPRCLSVEVSAVTPQVIVALTQALADQEVLIRGFDVNKQTLEDVFLSITGREIR